MTRLEYLRAILVEAEAFLDDAVEELADIKAWLMIHREKDNFGPFHVFIGLVTLQHRRASRVMDLMHLVHRRMIFTSQRTLNELRRSRSIAPEALHMATQMRHLAERSGRICKIIGDLFDHDFIGLTQHVVLLSQTNSELQPSPSKD